MVEPPWLAHARTLVGTRETPGPANNGRIMGWAVRARAWLGAAYAADSVPWCGLFMAEVMHAAGFKPPRAFVGLRAKAWAAWGMALSTTATRPPIGTIAVFGRDGGGHVGLVAGVYPNGDLAILGGNQADAVNIRRFPRTRLIAFRWPTGVALADVAPFVTGGLVTTGEQ
jgi:uncharacterized protein (TIGR02594 family)